MPPNADKMGQDGLAAAFVVRLSERSFWRELLVGHLGQQQPQIAPRWPPGGPQDRYTRPPRLLLPCVRILNLEAHGCRSGPCPRWKDSSLIVASVVPMQDDLSRRSPNHDDDLVFKAHGEPESVGVERPRLAEVADVEESGCRSRQLSCL